MLKISMNIQKLIAKGAITRVVPYKGQFIFNNFLPKPDGSDRLILNLKRFNCFVRGNIFQVGRSQNGCKND